MSSKTVLRFSIQSVSTGPSITIHCQCIGASSLFVPLPSSVEVSVSTAAYCVEKRWHIHNNERFRTKGILLTSITIPIVIIKTEHFEWRFQDRANGRTLGCICLIASISLRLFRVIHPGQQYDLEERQNSSTPRNSGRGQLKRERRQTIKIQKNTSLQSKPLKNRHKLSQATDIHVAKSETTSLPALHLLALKIS